MTLKLNKEQSALDAKSVVAVFDTHPLPEEVSRTGDYSEFVERPELLPREQKQLSFGSYRYWGINE